MNLRTVVEAHLRVPGEKLDVRNGAHSRSRGTWTFGQIQGFEPRTSPKIRVSYHQARAVCDGEHLLFCRAPYLLIILSLVGHVRRCGDNNGRVREAIATCVPSSSFFTGWCHNEH